MGTEQKINEPNTLKWIVLVEQTTRGYLRDNPLQEGCYEILVKGRIRFLLNPHGIIEDTELVILLNNSFCGFDREITLNLLKFIKRKYQLDSLTSLPIIVLMCLM